MMIVDNRLRLATLLLDTGSMSEEQYIEEVDIFSVSNNITFTSVIN